MYRGAGVAGRTRSRQGITGKQYFGNDTKRRKQHEVEEIASEDDLCSIDTVVSDDGDDDDAILIEDTIPDHDKEEDSGRTQPKQYFGNDNKRRKQHEEDSGRTRSRQGITGKQDFGNDNKRRKQHEVEEIASEDDLCSIDTVVSDDGDDDDAILIEDTIPDHDKEEDSGRTQPKQALTEKCEETGSQEEWSSGDTGSSDCGVDLFSIEKGDCDSRKDVTRSRYIAGRTRSHFAASKFRNAKAGTFSNPLCLDSEEKENEETSCSLIREGSLHYGLEEEDGILWALSACEDKAGTPEDSKPCLSSNSSFETEASQSPEKSEWDEEYLWKEMEECLQACQQDSPVQVTNDHWDDTLPEGELSRATRCERGDHECKMDDEIGEVCIHCGNLIRDIKEFHPAFGKYPSGRSGVRYSPRSADVDESLSSDPEHGCDDKSSGVFTTGTVWEILPRAKRSMYDHQQEAFEFLWTNLAGGIVVNKLASHLDFSSGGGCIISHAPGTGKTFLTIVFLTAFMRKYPKCRPMIIAPACILHTWEKELKKWEKVGVPVPFHNLNKPELSRDETKSAIDRLRKHGRRANTKVAILEAKVFSWKEAPSILGISYPLFDRQARKGPETVKKALLELPGVVVLDEGHTPRNSKSHIWDSLSKIKTKRRIILSGTPFQNNFEELRNTLRLAKPKFAESKLGSRGKLENHLRSYYKVGSERERAEIIAGIRDLIKPFVHVHRGTVLQESLPGLMESVIFLTPSQRQKSIFEHIKQLRGKEGWFKFEHLMSLASVHPSLFVDKLPDSRERGEEAFAAILGRPELSPEDGAKTKFVMDFIRQSQLMKEKVLIFSQYVVPLVFLAYQIKSCFDWNEGEQMMVIHGTTPEATRQSAIDVFNGPKSKATVMLASTKACCEGINLVGASRVILLDTLWNPAAERQAVSRAYRIGQKKLVYTYRLITAGTWDEKKRCSQAEKDQLSEMVFFRSNEAGHRQNASPVGFEDKLLEKMGRVWTKTTERGVTIVLESESRTSTSR